MSNQILDTPFEDDFPTFFEKEETVLWKGSPRKLKSGRYSSIEFQIKDQPTSDICYRKFENGKTQIYARLKEIENPKMVLELLKNPKEI